MKRAASLAGQPTPEDVESVSEFTRRVKVLLESGIRPGWVRGEVSNLRAQASGHVYFSLKDAGAQVSAVLFRGDAARQRIQLRDGLQVVVYGEVGVYEVRGQYQLIVRVALEDGVGRLQQEFEALKRRLAAEGLFAPERKRSIPVMPAEIGIITSPTGAALQDFLRILKRRDWRGRVLVLPARVQGEGAAEELRTMLDLAQEIGTLELLVIGRGGGSLEDLWAFNDEALARAVAASRLPVISAVGHEIDFTLCDLAADVRAETPSAAAELISSGFIACVERVERASQSLAERVGQSLDRARERLDHARSRLRLLSPKARLEQNFMRLDEAASRLGAALRADLHRRRQALAEVREHWARHAPESRIRFESHRLRSIRKRLLAASPASVLNRGFVIVRDEAGRPVARRASLRSGQRLNAEFADGVVPVRTELEADKPRKRVKRLE